MISTPRAAPIARVATRRAIRRRSRCATTRATRRDGATRTARRSLDAARDARDGETRTATTRTRTMTKD